MTQAQTVVVASQLVHAQAPLIFSLIADPSRQPEWDGNDNLSAAAAGQRVHAVGDVFAMELTKGVLRDNHVVEFVEGSKIAWKPSDHGGEPFGQLWRWELEPASKGATLVTHTYDWSGLPPEQEARIARAKATTSEHLAASLSRLAALAESL